MQPIFEEYGPYIYRESDSFTDLTYDLQQDVPGCQCQTKDGLTATFNVTNEYYTPYEDKMDSGIDNQMTLVN